MPTYTPSSGAIRASDIRSAFGISGSLSLGARRSGIYWTSQAYRGTLPSNIIKFSDFYSKSGTSPVTPGSAYYSANNGSTQGATYTTTFTVPLYYSMSMDSRAAGGGGGGGGGATYNFQGQLTSTGNGGPGGSGGNTTIGTYNTAYGGGGGSPNTAGADGAGTDNVAIGGSGGSSGYTGVAAGGKGGDGGFKSSQFISPINGGTGPAPGTVITITVGMGGSGGGGYGTGGAGSPGRYGEAAIYWG